MAYEPTFMADELRLLWHTNPDFMACEPFLLGVEVVFTILRLSRHLQQSVPNLLCPFTHSRTDGQAVCQQTGRRKRLPILVATIHFSPFTCCFHRFFRRSFTAFFSQRERQIHTITLMCTIHYLNSRVNRFTNHSNHIHIFTPITRIVATKLPTANALAQKRGGRENLLSRARKPRSAHCEPNHWNLGG